MGCVPCAAKRAARNQKYRWTDGTNVVIYDDLMAAKMKVLRRGGSYEPVDPEKIESP